MGKKLFLAILAIVLFTLVLSLLSVELVFKQQFTDYLTSSTEATIEQLPQHLVTAYKNGTWDSATLTGIGESLPLGIEVTLKDSKGQTVATLMNSMEAMHRSMGDPNMNNMMGMSMPYYAVQGWKTQSMTVTDKGETIGIAIIRYPASARILNPQDVSFMNSIINALLAAGALTLILGVLLSYFTSKRLVNPLQRLTQAAYRIGQGNLAERVSLTTRDEVGQLAQAFNSMADNLQRQESLRKQFIADIAHELRTPLTSMRSYIEAFQDGVLPPNQEHLSALNEEIDRLVGLASDLKDLNVAEMGALQVKLHPVNINSVIEKVINSLFLLIQEKGLDLQWNPPASSPEISGDERLLTRLFYNLIHNAYKYTESGGTIKISILPTKDSLQITIADSGIGIPADEIPLIFERFYRTDKSRARETGGSGIGLALVRQIVLLHRGKITVQSTVGQGTAFAITLPIFNS